MGLAGWIELIKGVLEFPSAVAQFIRLLRKTPAQNHVNLMEDMQKRLENTAKTGRPEWDV